MNNICNKLDKLNPPSFVTTPTSHKRSVVQKWSSLVTESRYKVLRGLLTSEVKVLTGVIERKGTQLRLEKALMLTKQIQKVAQRWKTNDFYPQLIQFQKSIGDFDEETGYLQSAFGPGKERLPSSQWSNWVIYLALRESALLTKISIECENTIKFWFGLIASGHHWGDSLVICGVLARIWFLASKSVDDFIQVIYPRLYEVATLLQPNKSPTWPSPDFLPPPDLLDWICNSMKLPFSRIDLSRDFKFTPMRRKKKSGPDNLSFLKNYFLPSGPNHETLSGDIKLGDGEIEEPDPDPDELIQEFTQQVHNSCETLSNKMNDEDIGIAVDRTQVPSKKRKKVQSETKARKKKKNQKCDLKVNSAEIDLSPSFATEENDNTVNKTSWKDLKIRWKKFFLNVTNKIESTEGRKKLLNRIKKMSKEEKDPKLGVKLKRLKKIVGQCERQEGASTRAVLGFNNLKMFVNKRVKKLKKQENQ